MSPAPSISTEEYLARRERLQALLREQDAAQFVATQAESIYYLCGATYEALERPFFLILPARGPVRLVLPELEREHLRKARGIGPDALHCYRDYPAPSGQCWQSVLAEHGGLTRGFLYEAGCPARVADWLRDQGGRPGEPVEQLRLVKSPTEIALIRRAAHYADRGVAELFAHSYYGATVAEGFARTSQVTQAIIRETPNWDALATRVLMASFPAPLSAMPHAVPSPGDRLLAGPHVTLVLTRVNGYAAESERTYFTAPPTRQERQLFELMVQARRIGLGLLRPGVACAEIDAQINAFLAREGVGSPAQRLHRCGHGFGLGNHEGPWLAEGSDDVLAAGMVVSMEPGIYLQGVGGYRHSDTLLITEDGFEPLTHAPGLDEPLVLQRRSLRQRVYHHLVSRALGLERQAG